MSKKSETGLTRRGFLRTLGVGGAVAAGAVLTPLAGEAAQQRITAAPKQELATLHDLTLCVGCGACVDACRESNAAKFPEPQKPFPPMYPEQRVKVSDWSDKRDVDDRLTPYNWLFLQYAQVEHEGKMHEINIPRRCMHCRNPPCANLCPWGAAGRETNGIVRINENVCLGGSKCRTVCPWHVPQRQTGVGLYLDLLPRLAGNGVMYKCDRCFQLVEQGQTPACISACPYDVQTIGPREEIVARAHARAEEIGGYIYGEHENGGTNTLYVSPVPFDKLQAALEQDEQVDAARGRPGLEPFPDMMAYEENLSEAALIAPFAGVAAGVLAAGRAMFGRSRSRDEVAEPREHDTGKRAGDQEDRHE